MRGRTKRFAVEIRLEAGATQAGLPASDDPRTIAADPAPRRRAFAAFHPLTATHPKGVSP
jgi:hypothetical protein